MAQAQVSTGALQGRRVSTSAGPVQFFGGVPYGRAGRFELPEPPSAWTAVRDATRPGPAAPQVVGGDAPVPGMAVGEIDEDCLTAQVWTSATAGKRPVLVWIPGGAYQTGSASLDTYDGALLAAEQDVVVVGLNYRLGALGYLFDPAVPSNLGLRDLVAALRWIRSEVANFGGDPERVVLMGESAGAGSICHLLALDETADLIEGAIVQSAAPGATLAPEVAAAVTSAFLAAVGVDSVDDLRELPLATLLAAQQAAANELLLTVGMMPYHPVVDGTFLAAAPLDAARAGSLARVPLVIGTTQNEMELFRGAVPELPAEFAEAFLQPKLAPLLGRGATLEEVRRGLASVSADLVEAIAHTDLHVPAALMSEAWVRAGVDVWRYQFSWQAPTVGAAHATDLPFTFGTFDVDGWREFVGAVDDRAVEAEQLSRRMRSAWGAFCHHLAPACEPIDEWPRCTRDDQPVVRLGADVTTAGASDLHELDAWLQRG